MDGKFVKYTENGEIMTIENYINGKGINEQNKLIPIKTYYDDKKSKIKEKYFEFNGQKEGKYILFHINGKKNKICIYVDGKIEGIHRTYNDNGQLEIICNYFDGKKEGKCEFYSQDGKKTHIEYYKNDELDKNYIYKQKYLKYKKKYLNLKKK